MAGSVARVGCTVSASLASSSKLDSLQSIRPLSVTSVFGLKNAVSRVSCTLEKKVTSVVDGANGAANAQSLRTSGIVGDSMLPTQRQRVASEGALNSKVSFMSMTRARDTLEDFCRSCFMFHDMDVENPAHVFRHLHVLLFFEAIAYQLDEQNEEHLQSPPMPSALGRDPFAELRAVLREQNLLRKRIDDKLTDGVEYWRLEQSLCAAMSAKEVVNEAYYEILSTAELLVEITDDLIDNEVLIMSLQHFLDKDVQKNSVNFVRLYSYIFGPRDAPAKLAEFILKTEEKYECLLNELEPHVVAKYRKRCEEGDKGDHYRAVPVLGAWRMPSLIADEEAFRKQNLRPYIFWSVSTIDQLPLAARLFKSSD